MDEFDVWEVVTSLLIKFLDRHVTHFEIFMVTLIVFWMLQGKAVKPVVSNCAFR